MTPRDKAIINHLQLFRCMTRDDIADLHFSGIHDKIGQANKVLKRLRRDRLITADTKYRKYIYFPLPRIKEDSSKTQHYLAIVAFYKALVKYGVPSYINIEPKDLGTGHPEPDIEMVWQGGPVMVEIQRNTFKKKDIEDKIERYRKYYYDEEAWKSRTMQKPGRERFPNCWMITERKYDLSSLPFHFYQSATVDEFMQAAKITVNVPSTGAIKKIQASKI